MPTTYDTLLEATSRLQVPDAVRADIKRFSEAELQAILEPNLAAYEQARAALQDKPRLADPDEALSPEKREKERSDLCNLDLILEVGAQLAELRGDFAEVARAGLCRIELGHVIRSGGTFNDFLVTFGCQGLGLERVRKLRDRLDDSTRRVVINGIVEWEKDWVPIKSPVPQSPDPLAAFEHQNIAILRMLVIDQALRSYREAEGRYPERLTALETILPEGIPLDPFTAAPFVYRREGNDSFHLYSPGPSGVDHGGIYGDLSAVTDGLADLCLDFSDL